ncbi:ABC transporter ATP-binding protein [Halorussus amylolyticus]|uniref:ABC transporter ATP-binding protein n=1 Tax=Halorussus amylolyticus TaxID=1126242 RepID=UPI0010439509|nr:ABC transporter ATP-binding protein [Halorussus amylolyticus]
MDDAISIQSLRKEYGDTVAIDGLDLSIPSGEVFGFLGPNGAGKSTTIDVMLNYVRPTAGAVTILGYDAVDESKAIRRRVGVLSDGYALYDRLTGREHVELAIELKGADDDPDRLLRRVGMADAADRPAGGYSKGMSQRLGLGVALVGSPDLLVFDEPASGLDPNGVRTLREIVREEADSGTTVFFSSHDLDQVEAVCDRVGILNRGELLAVDTVDGLRERLGAATRLCVDAVPLPDADRLSNVEGVGSVAAEDGRLVADCTDGETKFRLLSAVRESGATLVDFETETASLEDLFAASVGGSDIEDSAARSDVNARPDDGPVEVDA